MTADLKKYFVHHLLLWNKEHNHRSLLWKNEKEPYKIWLSEIMLQQTRAEQVVPYYKKFIHKFPTIIDLANASEDEVYKMWEGLGYYSRCRNLIYTARFIKENYKGIFPNTYEEIINLKGIGKYTAAAISSFAFNLPYGVIDGNVFRVISRFFGIYENISSGQGKLFFEKLINHILPQKDHQNFNQGIMDLGANICKPANPICHSCLLQKKCFAFNNDSIKNLPIKNKKTPIKQQELYFLYLRNTTQIILHKRSSNGIWKNLFEFIPIEKNSLNSVKDWITNHTHIDQPMIELIQKKYSQKLTHREIILHVFYTTTNEEIKLHNLNKEYTIAPLNDISKYAFPKIILDVLKDFQIIQ